MIHSGSIRLAVGDSLPAESWSTCSQEDEQSKFQHSMDAMYDRKLSEAIAEHIAGVIRREEAEKCAQDQQQPVSSDAAAISPFQKLQRSSSRVTFSENTAGGKDQEDEP